jgi:hypothetical protein
VGFRWALGFGWVQVDSGGFEWVRVGSSWLARVGSGGFGGFD